MVGQAVRAASGPDKAETRGAARLGRSHRGSRLIRYLDASALVKAFVAETGSEHLRTLVATRARLASSRLSYVECHSAFARREREGFFTPKETDRFSAALRNRWSDVAVVELDADVMVRAAELVRAHALRGADGIHLASAQVLTLRTSDDLEFVCWDDRLRDAASAAGLRVASTS